MKYLKRPEFQFALLILFFFVINLCQGYFTRLFEDEAYYFVWSKDLAFGYFDHPPLVALWVKFSSFFFQNELGVRFFSVLSFTVLLIMVWKLIEHPKKSEFVWLYFALIFSVAFLQVFGFITTPDTPLLMFTALFFYFYKRFLVKVNWFSIIGLGLTMSGMLYSKYHGLLVIIFVVLSNLKLLTNFRFWTAVLIAFIAFTPHLFWQYQNDFPSIRYHLLERAKKPYSLDKTLLHFVNQIAIVGLTFPVVYAAFFKQKARNKFERALKFVWFGFFFFFLYSTLNTTPQAQWTVVGLISLIVITFPFFVENEQWRKWLLILAGINFLVIIIARILLMAPSISPIELEPQWSENWVEEVKEKTQGKPLVFVNSYRGASIYNFYTGIKTHSYSILKGRKSQYDLSHFEDHMQHENVFAVGTLIEGTPAAKRNSSSDKWINIIPIENYQTYQKLQCIIEIPSFELKENERFEFSLVVKSIYPESVDWSNTVFFGVFQGEKNKILAKIPLIIESLPVLKQADTFLLSASFIVPTIVEKEDVTFRVGLGFYDLPEGFQGNKIPVEFISK
ncbi:ArnT family glycosyltransferase [Namhaeicola litoreus]|uniref:ArnT family glycosyltransferase n=1 Tax=Namhaeicola litoreus TaxID=1052145 RepID=A0ABW3Y054_9FLAO